MAGCSLKFRLFRAVRIKVRLWVSRVCLGIYRLQGAKEVSVG